MKPLNYTEDILNRLLNQLERRQKSDKPLSLNLSCYKDYRDNFSESQEFIDAAVSQLQGWGILNAVQDAHGYYTKVTMDLSQCTEAYSLIHRVPKEQILQAQRSLLLQAQSTSTGLAHRFSTDLLALMDAGKSLGYGIGQDTDKLRDILLILEKIDQLKTETYVRNFSEAVFHDSKRFQTLQTAIVHILMDYTPDAMDESSILEQYDLYQNPTYVYFKGGWILYAGENVFDVSVLPGGIGLPASALCSVTKIKLTGDTVISVENLTTYHDTPEEKGAILYLGGFPNHLRVAFLKLLYQDAPNASYFHRGDLDPYGFLILENLRSRTQIPFQPLEMDLQTLQHCYEKRHYRPLTAQDEKIMQHPLLARHHAIFDFMRQHNCKVEQECFEAMQLDL